MLLNINSAILSPKYTKIQHTHILKAQLHSRNSKKRKTILTIKIYQNLTHPYPKSTITDKKFKEKENERNPSSNNKNYRSTRPLEKRERPRSTQDSAVCTLASGEVEEEEEVQDVKER